MSDKPKRPWFRFHLLTAVLVTWSLAVSLLLNFSAEKLTFLGEKSGIEWHYGWPIRSFGVLTDLNGNRPYYYIRDYGYVAGDILAAFTMSVIVAFISESLIRRRESHKP